MTRPKRASGTRDQDATPFGAVLLRLCDSTGALAAALVDQEGETVDYAGTVEPFEIRVAAAEWRLVLRALGSSLVPGWAETNQIIVRARQRSFAVVALPEGYAIVLEVARRPHALWFGSSWVPIEVLGRYQLRGETGYRARLSNGAEINLVREKLGRWYAEDLPQS